MSNHTVKAALAKTETILSNQKKMLAAKEAANTLAEIDAIMETLAPFDDDEIQADIDAFDRSAFISGLDASGICSVLSNLKARIEGTETTSFDLKEIG